MKIGFPQNVFVIVAGNWIDENRDVGNPQLLVRRYC